MAAYGANNGNFKHGHFTQNGPIEDSNILKGSMYNVEEKVHKLADILRRYKHCEREGFPTQAEMDWANEIINERHEWWAKLAMTEAGWGA